METSIYTIGYEGVTIDMLINTLNAAGIKVLFDVRAVPLSRKPGFSKNKLAGRLAGSDISYLGVRDLGTPPAGRAAARKGRTGEMRAIFSDHLETPDASNALADVARISSLRRSCLLCYEHNPIICHRLLIADKIAIQTGQEIVHLNPVVTDI